MSGYLINAYSCNSTATTLPDTAGFLRSEVKSQICFNPQHLNIAQNMRVDVIVMWKTYSIR